MKKKSPNHRAARSSELCAEWREDDGLPPSVWAKQQQEPQRRHINYHGEQLCKQVRIALGDAFACDCTNPVFGDLLVIDVRMAKGTSVLEVIVSVAGHGPAALAEIKNDLAAAEGQLRASVGGAIHRKRVPRLKFHLAPAD